MDIYNEIQLEFSRENLQKVIQWGARPDSSPHSHQAIASWCERFRNKYCDIDAPAEIEEIMSLVAEIEMEWDIFVAHYNEKHPNNVTSSPRLPPKYFNKWLSQANT